MAILDARVVSELPVEPANSRRRACLEATAPALVGLLVKSPPGWGYCVTGGLPHDAVLVGAEYDSTRDVWTLCVVSAAFTEVPQGGRPPLLPPPTFQLVKLHSEVT